MKSLGDIILPESIQWTDQWEWTPVAQEVGRTLGGALVIWSQPLISGQPVTLVAEESVTWLTTEQVSAICALSAQSGATFNLVWGDDTFAVMFRNHDLPAVSFKPLWPNYFLFTGTIKLMKV